MQTLPAPMLYPPDSVASGTADSSSTDTDELGHRIERAQTALLFERTRISDLIAVPVALLVPALLYQLAQGTRLGTLVDGVADLAPVSAAGKGLSFAPEFRLPRPCWAPARRCRSPRQVLLNLTVDAVKFTEHGGVSLCVRSSGSGLVVFAVIDSGEGVLAGDCGRIFEPFRQGDASFGRRLGGTGPGLAISREMARAMGGDVSCHENPAGGGTRAARRWSPARSRRRHRCPRCQTCCAAWCCWSRTTRSMRGSPRPCSRGPG